MNQNFSGMSGHPEGRGRATPIFRQKLKLLKKATKVSYFFKFLSHRVDLEKFLKIVQVCWVFLRGVAHSLLAKN